MSLTRGQFVGLALWAGALGAEPALGQPSGVDRVERLLEFEHRLEAAYGAALERGAIDAPLGRTLPVGVVTALLGAPFFLWLVVRMRWSLAR